MTRRIVVACAFVAMLTPGATAWAQTTTPVPKPAPFPGTTPPPATAKQDPVTAKSPATAQDGASVDPRLAGIPIYPGAQLLFSFDAGRGQHVFTFGTDMPFSDIVAFYRNQLRSSGTEVFRTPLIQQFDVGPFRADTMVYRPSVVVKDYATDPAGYLHVSGTTETRYRSVIQIVPMTK